MQVRLHPHRPDTHVVLNVGECPRLFRMLTEMADRTVPVFNPAVGGFEFRREDYSEIRQRLTQAHSLLDLLGGPERRATPPTGGVGAPSQEARAEDGGGSVPVPPGPLVLVAPMADEAAATNGPEVSCGGEVACTESFIHEEAGGEMDPGPGPGPGSGSVSSFGGPPSLPPVPVVPTPTTFTRSIETQTDGTDDAAPCALVVDSATQTGENSPPRLASGSVTGWDDDQESLLGPAWIRSGYGTMPPPPAPGPPAPTFPTWFDASGSLPRLNAAMGSESVDGGVSIGRGGEGSMGADQRMGKRPRATWASASVETESGCSDFNVIHRRRLQLQSSRFMDC